MSSVMIAWVRYQRRADIMREFWLYDDIYITSRFRSKILKPLDYICKIYKSVIVLAKYKPDHLWMQLPPTIMLFIGFLYRFLSRKKVVLIGDFHNSALRPKWFNIIGVRSCLNRLDVLIAHNEQVKNELIKKGISSDVIFVLEDMPFSYEKRAETIVKKNTVLFPCSFDVDEPLEVVLKAAERMPNVKIYVTGKYEGKIGSEIIKNAPKNVTFTGYLSNFDFDSLFWECEVILGLTTRDNVQLSVSNEALSAGKPMVLSRTTTLESLFGDAAVFVDSLNDESIAKGCFYALGNAFELGNNTLELKEVRSKRWVNQAGIIKNVFMKSVKR